MRRVFGHATARLIQAHQRSLGVTLVCARDVCACRLSAPDRFIVEGQRCLVLSLKQPVFSPEGSN